MQVLNNQQIVQKITRMSYEILEGNLEMDEIVLLGVNQNGSRFASLIFDKLKDLTTQKITLSSITLDPAAPLGEAIAGDFDYADLDKKCLIIVDDVANTGRTIFYACKVFMNVLVAKLQVAVLVDRRHKYFPIAVDYIGLALATTVKENIKADLSSVGSLKAELL